MATKKVKEEEVTPVEEVVEPEVVEEVLESPEAPEEAPEEDAVDEPEAQADPVEEEVDDYVVVDDPDLTEEERTFAEAVANHPLTKIAENARKALEQQRKEAEQA